MKTNPETVAPYPAKKQLEARCSALVVRLQRDTAFCNSLWAGLAQTALKQWRKKRAAWSHCSAANPWGGSGGTSHLPLPPDPALRTGQTGRLSMWELQSNISLAWYSTPAPSACPQLRKRSFHFRPRWRGHWNGSMWNSSTVTEHLQNTMLADFSRSAMSTLPRKHHLKHNQVTWGWFLRGSSYRGSCHQLLYLFPASSVGMVQLFV